MTASVACMPVLRVAFEARADPAVTQRAESLLHKEIHGCDLQLLKDSGTEVSSRQVSMSCSRGLTCGLLLV